MNLLKLTYHIIKLNKNLIKQLNKGSDIASLQKEFNQVHLLTARLTQALQAKVNEESSNSGTTAAHKRASTVH